ncbi:MAG: hypothetical protein PHR35_10420 [Kiritimatiellae bacterium]|nr:hypothetical protein [Kiritimatiellia bacterium]
MRRYLTPEARLLALLAALLTALLTIPACIGTHQECRRLRTLTADLQARIENLQQALSRDGTESSDATPETETGSAAPSAPAPVIAAPVAAPSPAVAPASDSRKAAAVMRELATLPNGMRREQESSNGVAVTIMKLDELAPNLARAYALLESGQNRDAAIMLESIAATRPDWPYVHYYLALASGRREAMERAVGLFGQVRKPDVLPPEGKIYYVLARLFTGDIAEIGPDLADIATLPPQQGLGPLYGPRHIPSDLRQQYARLPCLQGVRTVEWPR